MGSRKKREEKRKQALSLSLPLLLVLVHEEGRKSFERGVPVGPHIVRRVEGEQRAREERVAPRSSSLSAASSSGRQGRKKEWSDFFFVDGIRFFLTFSLVLSLSLSSRSFSHEEARLLVLNCNDDTLEPRARRRDCRRNSDGKGGKCLDDGSTTAMPRWRQRQRVGCG